MRHCWVASVVTRPCIVFHRFNGSILRCFMDAQRKSRREFIKLAGVAGIGLGAAACTANATPPPPATGSHDNIAAAPEASATPEDMDAMHEAGVKKFLDGIGKDPNFWPKKLAPTMD